MEIYWVLGLATAAVVVILTLSVYLAITSGHFEVDFRRRYALRQEGTTGGETGCSRKLRGNCAQGDEVLHIMERIRQDVWIVGCARCDGSGRFYPSNALSQACPVCGGRGKLLIRTKRALLERCVRCDGSGRQYPPNEMSDPCANCLGVGAITVTGSVEILDWGELLTLQLPSGFGVVVFTDMAGSTSLTQRLGDEKAQDVVREHFDLVHQVLQRHHGYEIKDMGDGVMAFLPRLATRSHSWSPFNAPSRTGIRTRRSQLASRLASTLASRLRKQATCSAALFSSPLGSALMLKRDRSSSRTWCGNWREARASSSWTPVRGNSRGLGNG